MLSTLHTNDAPGAVTRLIDLSVAPYLVSASLIGVLAQRLVRKICPNCKEEYEPAAPLRRAVEKWSGGIAKYYRGIGCKKCRNTGYAGRIAIHELFIPDDDIHDKITQGETLKAVRQAAVQKGMKPLYLDGLEKVRAGITTIDEILRVADAPST